MITIQKRGSQLLLRYTSTLNDDARWVDHELKTKGVARIRKTFAFRSNSVVKPPSGRAISEDTRLFVLGVEDGEYYKIDRRILDIKYDLRLLQDMPINARTFVAYRDISIFHKLDGLVDEASTIGGDANGAIPLADFNGLLQDFPTSTEVTHYANARITRKLKDYLGTMSDAQVKLSRYLNRKRKIKPVSRVEFLQEYEPKKFEYVRDELTQMLQDSESYKEREWQSVIVSFLLLIFPKYVGVLEGLRIPDSYSKAPKDTYREIDLTLLDANGTIDIIEIKQPFAACLLSSGKYRNAHYTPRSELSGAVMQVEKYIFLLNKWGSKGEEEIRRKHKDEIPPHFSVKITNPKAMIILGRDLDFTDDQKFDFEIMKLTYANVIDLITYDDLLRRLDVIISMIKRNYSRLKKKGGAAH